MLQALKDPDSQVCSIYGPNTVSNVYDTIKKTVKGNALFTFPNTPVKCPGAPQKIAYLSEDYWSQVKKNFNKLYYEINKFLFEINKFLFETCVI